MSASFRQTPLTCPGHTRPVVDLAFSGLVQDGYYLISACKDGKPMLRQGETGDWVGTFEGHKGAVWGATLNKDATRAATGAADFTAKVWNSTTGDEMHTFPHKHIVRTVDFSQDGVHLLTGSNEKLLRIFDLNKAESDPVVLSGHTASIRDAIWTRDGKKVISCAEDRTIKVFDVDSASELMSIDVDANVTSLELSPDGLTLTTAQGKSACLWNAETMEIKHKFESPSVIFSASYNQEQSLVVAGGDDFKLYKYSLETGEEVESYKGHFGPVHCVRFSPDGELYASGSEDGTVRLWQTVVGRTYGLWKCVHPTEPNNCTLINNDIKEIEVQS